MSWTRSMSSMARTSRAASNSSSVRTATVRAAASANGRSAVSPGMSRALAILSLLQCSHAPELTEDDSLAQPPSRDEERPAEEHGRLLEEQHPGGQDAHTLGMQVEAPRDLLDGRRRQHVDAALQRFIGQLGADEAPQRGRATADRERGVHRRDLEPLEDALGVA